MTGVEASLGDIWGALQAGGMLGALALASKFYLDRRRLQQDAVKDDRSASDRLQDRLEARVVRLEQRCDAVEAELAECHRERDEWRSRAVAAEAFLSGEGQARQVGQVIVSTEREADAAARRGKRD